MARSKTPNTHRTIKLHTPDPGPKEDPGAALRKESIPHPAKINLGQAPEGRGQGEHILFFQTHSLCALCTINPQSRGARGGASEVDVQRAIDEHGQNTALEGAEDKEDMEGATQGDEGGGRHQESGEEQQPHREHCGHGEAQRRATARRLCCRNPCTDCGHWECKHFARNLFEKCSGNWNCSYKCSEK